MTFISLDIGALATKRLKSYCVSQTSHLFFQPVTVLGEQLLLKNFLQGSESPRPGYYIGCDIACKVMKQSLYFLDLTPC